MNTVFYARRYGTAYAADQLSRQSNPCHLQPVKASLAVGAKPARRFLWKSRFDPHFAAVLAHKTEGETGGRARRPASVLLGRRKSIGAPRGNCTAQKKSRSKDRFAPTWRRHPDLNRGIEILQTFALPLGYGANALDKTALTVKIP